MGFASVAIVLVLVLLRGILAEKLLSFVDTYELTLDQAYSTAASASISRPVNTIFIHAIFGEFKYVLMLIG